MELSTHVTLACCTALWGLYFFEAHLHVEGRELCGRGVGGEDCKGTGTFVNEFYFDVVMNFIQFAMLDKQQICLSSIFLNLRIILYDILNELLE